MARSQAYANSILAKIDTDMMWITLYRNGDPRCCVERSQVGPISLFAVTLGIAAEIV
jgi:hypothetical protein